eukprot:403366776
MQTKVVIFQFVVLGYLLSISQCKLLSQVVQTTDTQNETSQVSSDESKPPCQYTPIVFIHGLSTNCTLQEPLMTQISDMMNNSVYYSCVEIGNGNETSWYTPLFDQTKEACQKLMDHPVYSKEKVNIIGYSQGGLIARALVETCPAIKFRKLITFGTPHGGIAAVRDCQNDTACLEWNEQVRATVYTKYTQQHLAPAGYFRDYTQLPAYYKYSSFLPYINNEKGDAAMKYLQKSRLLALEHFRMFMFTRDRIVYPKESAWFANFNEKGRLVLLQDQELYKKDWLGMRALTESNRATYYSIEGAHMEFTQDYLEENLLPLLID